MKILVIGGTGLLSTAVAQRLIDRGDAVTVLNRGLTPSRLTGAFRAWKGDLEEAEGFSALVRSETWDAVLDMINSLPERAAQTAAACAGRTRQLLFCSTTSVYPKPAGHYPVREDHPPGAAFANGISKAACEAVYRDAEAKGLFAATLVRPGQIYGETGGVLHSLGQTPGLSDRLRRGLPVVVHGDGQGLWSALHAEDVAAVFTAAAGNPAAFGAAYNAAGDEWMTWDQYHERIAAALGVPPPPLLHAPVEVLCALAPQAAAQAKRSLQYPGVYDMTRARRDLGWRQQIPFVEGMRRTLRWLEANRPAAVREPSPDYAAIAAAVEAWRARNSLK